MNRSLLVLTALTATLFAGCNPCFNVECDAPDTAMINALRFRFSTADFAWGEVDSAMVVRYAKGSSVGIDTFRLADQFASGDSVITLTDGTPFAGAETFGNFDYVIFDNSLSNAYRIADIKISGTYPKDCCCCYRNITRTFGLNGAAIDRSGDQDPMELSKF
jgi:hypothetical protein